MSGHGDPGDGADRPPVDSPINVKRYPPHVGHIRVPVSSVAAALAAMQLYTPSKRLASVLHACMQAVVRVAGPRCIPGSVESWVPPVPPEIWPEMRSRLSREVGPFDSLAIHERRSSTRKGFSAVLLRGSEAVGFARIQQHRGDRVRREFHALQLAFAHPGRPFLVAEPIATGEVGGWSYLLTGNLAGGRHRVPSDPPIASITAAISEALRPLPRPADTPAHWEPMHGDFTPWNLRERPDGSLVLYDWEHAAWAPPGADETLYSATDAAVRGRRFVARHPEAIDYWLQRSAASQFATRRHTEALHAALRGNGSR